MVTPHVFSEREAFLSLRRSLLPWGLCAPMKTLPRTGLGSSLGGRERHPHQLICRQDFHQPEVQSPPVIPAPLPATLSGGLVGDIHAPSPSKTALQLRSLLFVFSGSQSDCKESQMHCSCSPSPREHASLLRPLCPPGLCSFWRPSAQSPLPHPCCFHLLSAAPHLLPNRLGLSPGLQASVFRLPTQRVALETL